MALTISAIDLIARSMRLINAISAGEIPEKQDLNDALITLNEMLDGWNLQPMAVYGSVVENVVVTPGKADYDWGLSAVAPNIQTVRPVEISNATCVRNQITTPVLIVSQDEFDRIAFKNNAQPIIEQVCYVNSFPLGKLLVYPVPTEAVTLTLNTLRQLQGPINLQATLAFPPGYQEAIRYNLAVKLWPEYTNPNTDIDEVRRVARETLGWVKKQNQQDITSTFEDIPNVDTSRNWDWRVG